MSKILGFDPEKKRIALKEKIDNNTAALDDLFAFFGRWIRNIEHRTKEIERILKIRYPEE